MPTRALARPALLLHAGVVLLLVVVHLVLSNGLVELLLVVAGIPWSAFAVNYFGAAYDVLLCGGALLNVALHAAYRWRAAT